MSGLGNIARIVFRVILAMVFVLITGEFLVRAFIGSPSTHVFDPEIGYAYQPNSEIFQVKEGVTRLHFNSLGLNDAEIGPKNGRCRVLVVGDSYATALQVPQSDNFTAVAERLDAKLDVVNAGRDGLFLGDLQKVSNRLVNKVHADFVVYVISLRAVEADIHLSGFRVTTDPQSGAVTDATMKVEDKEQLKQSFEWILQKSALVTRLAVQLKPALSDAQQSVATFLSWVSSTGKADTSDRKSVV